MCERAHFVWVCVINGFTFMPTSYSSDLIYSLLCGIVQILQAGVCARVCRFVFMAGGDVC